MKRLKAVLAVVFVLIFVFLLCSCKKKEKNNNTEETTSAYTDTSLAIVESDKILKLAYSSTDSLNPFNAKSINNQSLATLMYDSLYVLDEKYNASELIAASSDMNNGAISVTIKNDIKFSDGSALTVSDVLYSFSKAKASLNYANALINVASATIKDSTITFKLKYADSAVKNCLTFPIVKAQSADGSDLPIGSGRYVFDNATNQLVFNSLNSRGISPEIQSINLVNVSDSTALINSLQIGNISFSFQDLSSGSYSRINANTADVVLNNLVYVGINSKSTVLANANVIKAINSAID
nr:hypothetical protein [Clostridiales bacterium]